MTLSTRYMLEFSDEISYCFDLTLRDNQRIVSTQSESGRCHRKRIVPTGSLSLSWVYRNSSRFVKLVIIFHIKVGSWEREDL